jgi:DNA-binding NarL/FixJ family response regulator
MANVIRSVLADDDRDFRFLVRLWIERVEPGSYEVVGEAGSGHEVIDLVEELAPDLVLLDLTMPGTDSMGVITELRQRFPATSIVVLSGFDHESVVDDVVGRGAIGYLEKGIRVQELRSRLDRMMAR